MTFIQAIFSLIAFVIVFFLVRYAFFYKDNDGRYKEHFGGTFLWEYGKWFGKATIFIIILMIVIFGVSGIFGI
jgi:heme/copper-type cytochrome/quinol oxidase subunit 2